MAGGGTLKLESQPGLYMARARNYRSVKLIGKDMGAVGSYKLIASISPLDSQQSVAGYLHNFKLSCWNYNMTAGPAGPAFLVMATSDDTAPTGESSHTLITAAATASGGGTINLSLKRAIRDSDEDPSRSDGPVYIWVGCSGNEVSPDEDYLASFVAEAWGRFIELVDES